MQRPCNAVKRSLFTFDTRKLISTASHIRANNAFFYTGSIISKIRSKAKVSENFTFCAKNAAICILLFK